MSRALKRVLLVAGRDLQSNPYRELLIKHGLERHGVAVRYVIPGRGLNKGASLVDIDADPLLKREGTIRVDGEWAFRKAMRGCQMVVFSTWRSYLSLTLLARAEGRATINFCATSGLDHWTHGVERCLVRSAFTRRLLRHEHETMGLPLPPDDQIRVVGSVQYEYLDDRDPLIFQDRAEFCAHYGLDPARPIAVLFPKGIQSFHKKVAAWFPDWETERVDRYNQWFLDKYGEICLQAREAGCNLLVKMHPTAYAAYNCDTDFEYAFWRRYPWARVIAPGHTRAMYQYADVGLGINSHSALDMNYFGKPFVYVDSDLMAPPDHPAFDNIKLGVLPLGPSSHWGRPDGVANPWFRSWLGAFARAGELPGLLADPGRTMPIDPEERRAFIEEYWGMADGRASGRIIDEILAFGEEHAASGWSLPRLRGLFWDGIEALRVVLHPVNGGWQRGQK